MLELYSQICCSKRTHILKGVSLDLIAASEQPREKAVGVCRPLPVLLSIIQDMDA